MEEGKSEIEIAKALRLSFPTWKRIREEDPKAYSAWAAGRAEEEVHLVEKLKEAVTDKSINAIPCMFLLKTRHGYRENSPIDQKDQQGAQININLPASLSIDQYSKLIHTKPSKRLGNGGGSD